MARKPKSEGTRVRLAFTGPSIDHDKLIAEASDRNEEDRLRASSAGESRSKIKAFLDETGMNGKALSWLRMILKTSDKDDGQAKAMDVIMSLEKGLPMIKSHIGGQGTAEMELEPAPASYAADFDVTDDPAPVIAAEITDAERDAAGALIDDDPVEPADDFLASDDAA